MPFTSPGCTFVLSAETNVPPPRPTASERPVATGPLSGVRVLDLSRVLAGPWCVQNLADLGADVIKVERPGTGDDSRHWGPPFMPGLDGEPSSESVYFMAYNRNKRSVTIDFTRPEGQALVRRLVADADICIENFKVGDLARYGLDYASLSELNPRLIYCSLTGFGQDGPWAQRPGYDYLFQGLGGLMSVTGEPDGAPGGGPQRIGIALVDLFTGMYAIVGILSALQERHRSGNGQHIDISLLGTVMAMGSGPVVNYMLTGKVPERTGNIAPQISPYGVYPCADGPLIVASANQKQFAEFCRVLAHPEWVMDARFATNADRVRNRDALNKLFCEVMVTRGKAEWEDALLAAGVPAGPINTYAQALDNPQVRHLGTVVSVAHALGVEAPGVANPLRFSRTPVNYRSAPPLLGQHTREVLAEVGLQAAEIDALAAAGVISTHDT